MMKKLVSLLLAVAMVLTVLPAAVLAADADDAGLVSSKEETAEAQGASTQTAVNQDNNYGPEESEIIQPQSEMAVTPEELAEAVEDVMLAVFGSDTDADTTTKASAGYVERHASQQLIDYIKVHENTVQNVYYPMWDVSQWSIGFGSRCPNSPAAYKEPSTYTVEDFQSEAAYDSFMGYVNDGMPLAEAEQLLVDFVENCFAPAVNNAAKKYGVYLTQNQFDALLDFSYALGAGWTSGSRMQTGLRENYHGTAWPAVNSLDNAGWYFINAMGTWCHVSGAANHGAATRRVQDLEVFAYGDYYKGYYDMRAQNAGHFTYLIFNANGGKCVNPAGTEDWATTNRFYFAGAPYGSLMNAERAGYYFAGWYTEASGGTKITADTIAQMNTNSNYYAGIPVYAHWSKDPADPEIGSATGSGSTGFTDVSQSAWYAEYINRAVELGLFNGTSATTFSPDVSLTRAMAVTILFRLSGEADTYTGGQHGFSDVAAGAYYAKAVAWAVEKGIVNGVTPTQFKPDDNITREQLSKMLYTYTKACGKDVSYRQPAANYTDFDQISHYAIPSMCWAVTHGIINGDTDTTLSPKKTTTRAQAATIFVRYVEQFG